VGGAMKRNPIAVILVVYVVGVCQTASANVAVTNAINNFMITLYSNDKAGYEKTILPHTDSHILVGKQKLTEDQLGQVREDVSAMRLMQTDPYRLHGKDVKPDDKGEYPVGTKATFMTQFRGVNLAIPVVRTSDGWKVDVRYWLVMQKEYKETDPEVVTRKFLYCLISRKKKELKEVSIKGCDLAEILKGKAPLEDQYYCLAMEMPVVEAQPGEGMLLPGNEILQAQVSAKDHKWFVGMYGMYQLVFELKKEKKSWRIVPRDYLSVIGIGVHPPTTITELQEGEQRMGL